jgi:hypothetical protein
MKSLMLRLAPSIRLILTACLCQDVRQHNAVGESFGGIHGKSLP